MSEALSFRPMTEADLDAVLKIEYAAYSHPLDPRDLSRRAGQVSDLADVRR
jgi:hypothetical protein